MKRRRARTCFCPYRACGLFMAGPRPLCGPISALPRIPRRQAALRRSANVRFAACAEHHGVAGGAATAAHAACSRLHRDRRAGGQARCGDQGLEKWKGRPQGSGLLITCLLAVARKPPHTLEGTMSPSLLLPLLVRSRSRCCSQRLWNFARSTFLPSVLNLVPPSGPTLVPEPSASLSTSPANNSNTSHQHSHSPLPYQQSFSGNTQHADARFLNAADPDGRLGRCALVARVC